MKNIIVELLKKEFNKVDGDKDNPDSWFNMFKEELLAVDNNEKKEEKEIDSNE